MGRRWSSAWRWCCWRPVPRSAVSVLRRRRRRVRARRSRVALAGGLLAALAAFGLSRALGRPAVTRLAGPRLARVDRLMADRGFVAVLAGRLLPVVPFVVLSYGAGLTAIRWAPYAARDGARAGAQHGACRSASARRPASVVDRATPCVLAGAGWPPSSLAAAAAPVRVAPSTRRRRGGRPSPCRNSRPSMPPAPPTVRAASCRIGPPGMPGHRLHDRGELQQAADVVHLQLAAGDGRHRVDPAGRGLEEQVGRAPRRPARRTRRRAPGATVQPSRVGRRTPSRPSGVASVTPPVMSIDAASAPVTSASAASPDCSTSGGGGAAPQDTRSRPWTASS